MILRRRGSEVEEEEGLRILEDEEVESEVSSRPSSFVDRWWRLKVGKVKRGATQDLDFIRVFFGCVSPAPFLNTGSSVRGKREVAIHEARRRMAEK